MLARGVRFGYRGEAGRIALIFVGDSGTVVVTRSRPRGAARGVDFGPGARRRPLRDAAGRVIREPDVAVNDQAADPDNPNRRLRRAYRVDPVELLRRSGTLGAREVEAAEELRECLERVVASRGGDGARVSLSGYPVEPISDSQMRASRRVREARALLGPALWPGVLWLCLGGSVRGYCDEMGIDRRRGTGIIVLGLQRLAVHFFGDGVTG